MEKFLDSTEVQPAAKPRFSIFKEASPSVKIVNEIESVYEAFDNLDDEERIQFVVKETKTTVTPPIPPSTEVVSYLLRNALLLIDSGEFKLARNVLGDLLRRDHNHVDAIRWMGWCFKQEGDFENALKCYEQLAQRRVTEQDLFELGEVYYSLKKDNEAQIAWLDALGQCDAESPRLFDLHKNLGNVFTRQGDFDSAEENYNKALIIRPNSDVLHVNLGSLNFQRQQFKSAMEYFKKGLELNAHNDKAWCGVALVAREMKDPEWALSVLLRCLEINPYNQTALQVLINWSQVDHRWDDAIQRVHTYLDKFQDDGDFIYSLAGLYFQKGSMEEAQIELIRLNALQPEREDAFELKKIIEQQKGLQA